MLPVPTSPTPMASAELVLTSDVEHGFGEGAASWALSFTDIFTLVTVDYSFNDQRAVGQHRETTRVVRQKHLQTKVSLEL